MFKNKLIAVFFILVVVIFYPTVIKSQTVALTSSDKEAIITVILQKYFKTELKKGESLSKDRKSIYIFLEDVSLNQIPQFKELNFIKINEEDKKRFEKTGGFYYRFGNFVERNSTVEINFGYTQIGYEVLHLALNMSAKKYQIGGKLKKKTLAE